MLFPSFPHLPLELRLQIWEYAIPNGVYVEFSSSETKPRSKSKSKSKSTGNENGHQHLLARCADHAVPAILHASSESRSVALPHYVLLSTPPSSSHTYFNPSLDTLLLSSLFQVDFSFGSIDPSALLGPDVGAIQHIAYHQLHDIGWAIDYRFIDVFSGGLRSFTFLDLSEWVDTYYPSVTEMRGAMSSEVFRQESLVRGEEEGDKRNPWCSSAKCSGESFGRVLEVGVVRLPVPDRRRMEAKRRKDVEREREVEEVRRRREGYWGVLVRGLVRWGLLDWRRSGVRELLTKG